MAQRRGWELAEVGPKARACLASRTHRASTTDRRRAAGDMDRTTETFHRVQRNTSK